MIKIQRGWNELGMSHEGRSIRAFANFDSSTEPSPGWTLILGGTHGDERATVVFLDAFIADHLEGKKDLGPAMVIPVLNPDGYERNSRYNARGVDLNRNLPELWSRESDEPSGSEPLSELETRLLYDLLMTSKPARIVSLHWALSEIDADGDKEYAWAQDLWENLEESHRRMFRLRQPDNRPLLPGSLGTFCRHRFQESTSLMTLELPYHHEPKLDPLPEDHFTTVGDLWDKDRERYWNAVYPAVVKILRFAIGT